MIIVVPTLIALFNVFSLRRSLARQAEGGFKTDQKSNRTMPERSDSDIESQEAPTSIEEQQLKLECGLRKLLPAVLAYIVLVVGLAVSGMVQPSKLFGFLNLMLFWQGSYDPTLITVMAAGCIVSFISYQFVKPHSFFPSAARECPFVANEFSVPTNTTIDFHLIFGALCFGVGWGIAGLCPGPALFLAATGTHYVIYGWFPAYLAGAFLATLIKG